MKHATLHHLSLEHGFKLSQRSLEILRAALSALAPYAVMAIALFMYHEQFPK